MSQSRAGTWFPLILISSISLFLELAVVRWISVEVRLLAYFKNLPLLAAFLGLAIGFALVNNRQDYKKTFSPLFFIFTLLVLTIGRFSSQRSLAYPSFSEEFLWYTAPISYWTSLILFLEIILIFFLITMLLFIPIGQATGEEMALHEPVPAYIVNIAASLLGIWVFSLFSFLQTSPLIWFGLGIAGMALFNYLRTGLRRRDFAFFALSLGCLVAFKSDYIWSPYQRLSVTDFTFKRISDSQPVKVGYTLNVQQVFFQHAIDLSQAFVRKYGKELLDLENTAYVYNLPYRLTPRSDKVLIIGSGMGNDVAAAIRNGANSIDAVEIDPAILQLGLQLHPEKPYSDPRVTRIVDDARSFFVKSKNHYELVVSGFLDSHSLLSSLSSVRLDSYVYTQESF